MLTLALSTRYGSSCDWVVQFIERESRKSLRQLFKEIIFEPLGLPPSEIDTWLSPSLREGLAGMHIRAPEKGFINIPFSLYTAKDRPPEGKSCSAGCIFASLQTYAKLLQAVLNHDPRILSEEVWKTAIKDDLTDRGIKVPRPEWKSHMQDLASEYVLFALCGPTPHR